MSLIAVIGAGSWGTALAASLGKLCHEVRLWAYEQDVVENIRHTGENRIFLPGVALPSGIAATNSIGEALEGAQFVVSAVPSHVCRTVYGQMLPYLTGPMIFVSATKGLELDTLLRMSEVIRSVTGSRFSVRLTVLSGPSFALEVARGEPTAVVVASEDEPAAQLVQQAFSSSTLRLYTSNDVIGVETGGAIKNVIAIAAGVIEGLGLGHNAMAALVTRGLAEISRLGIACGARAETLAGLAGLGDLVLTCTGQLSRNRMVGVELGKGRALADILASTRMVAEGVKTTAATVALAGSRGVEMPITSQIHRLLEGEISPRDAIRELMERTLKTEHL